MSLDPPADTRGECPSTSDLHDVCKDAPVDERVECCAVGDPNGMQNRSRPGVLPMPKQPGIEVNCPKLITHVAAVPDSSSPSTPCSFLKYSFYDVAEQIRELNESWFVSINESIVRNCEEMGDRLKTIEEWMSMHGTGVQPSKVSHMINIIENHEGRLMDHDNWQKVIDEKMN